MAERRPGRPGRMLARQLKAVLDERFVGDLEKLSRSPPADVNDGLGARPRAAGHDRARGRVLRRPPRADDSRPRAPRSGSSRSQTLREVPAAFRDLTTPALDRHHAGAAPPAASRARSASGRSSRFWALIPVAWLVARLLVTAPARPRRRAFARRLAAADLARQPRPVPRRRSLSSLAAPAPRLRRRDDRPPAPRPLQLRPRLAPRRHRGRRAGSSSASSVS